MKLFSRGAEPLILQQKSARWNSQWAALRQRNAGAVFKWYRHENTPVNQIILPDLRAQTQDHCSYCDGFPLFVGDDTIDHFRPKSEPAFYRLAYTWSNLYIACNHCQTAKGVQFSALLLRPDDVTYSFERYFIYNYATHTVDINTGALLEDQQRAAETIKIFDFNHAGKIIQRRHCWERRTNNPVHDGHLDDFSYRFIFI